MLRSISFVVLPRWMFTTPLFFQSSFDLHAERTISLNESVAKLTARYSDSGQKSGSGGFFERITGEATDTRLSTDSENQGV